jgi:hypothetical protein
MRPSPRRAAVEPAHVAHEDLGSEQAVRLAQKVQVGPCIPVGIQLEKAEVGPTSGPTRRPSRLARAIRTPPEGPASIFSIGICIGLDNSNYFWAPRKQVPGGPQSRGGARTSPRAMWMGRRSSPPFSEQGVRLAQKMQVGPRIPVGIQLKMDQFLDQLGAFLTFSIAAWPSATVRRCVPRVRPHCRFAPPLIHFIPDSLR